MNRITIFTSRS